MKVVYFLLFIFSLVSCNDSFTTSEMKNNFSSDEIKDLKTIVDFYKGQLSNEKNNDFEKVFNETLVLYQNNQNRDNFYNVNFNSQKNIYDSISESTFNKIWLFNKSYDFEESTIKKRLGFKYEGNYNSFLKDVAKNNSIINEYIDILESAGDFSNSNYLIYDILKNKESYNLKDPNIQLIIAIDNLSINDNLKRNEKFE